MQPPSRRVSYELGATLKCPEELPEMSCMTALAVVFPLGVTTTAGPDPEINRSEGAHPRGWLLEGLVGRWRMK